MLKEATDSVSIKNNKEYVEIGDISGGSSKTHTFNFNVNFCIVSELSINDNYGYFTSATMFVIMNGQTVIHGSNSYSLNVKFSLINNVLTISNTGGMRSEKYFYMLFKCFLVFQLLELQSKHIQYQAKN